jgi:serine/threonine protein kinase
VPKDDEEATDQSPANALDKEPGIGDETNERVKKVFSYFMSSIIGICKRTNESDDYFAVKDLLHSYKPKTESMSSSESESLLSLGSIQSGSPFGNEDHIKAFINDLYERAISKTIRGRYLSLLQRHKAKELLNDSQLCAIFKFVLAGPEIIRIIDNMQPGTAKVFSKKNYKGLPRTIQIEKELDGSVKLYVLPQSKLADNSKDPSLKWHGTSKTVTLMFLLNPQFESETIVHVSKKQRLYNLDSQESQINRVRRENEFTKRSGEAASVSEVYTDSKGIASVRTTEVAAVGELSDLLDPEKAELILALDVDYKLSEESKSIILTRLIGDILVRINAIHKAGIIHNDMKELNILVYVDEKGNLRARISDYGLSIYASERISDSEIMQLKEDHKIAIQAAISEGRISQQDGLREYAVFKAEMEYRAERSQLVATAPYSSPQVVGFTLAKNKMNKKITFPSLLLYFMAPNPCFAKELLSSTGILPDFTPFVAKFLDLKPDPKDDMFSLGVTIFMTITGCYPTLHTNLDEKVAFEHNKLIYKYLNIEHALIKYPLLKQFEALFNGLIAARREDRLSAESAIILFNRIEAKNQSNTTNKSI